jgi:hypothetical protein
VEAAQRINDALDIGRVVVVPGQTVPFGGRERLASWTIDPQTGSTIDSLDDGAGGLGEYLEINTKTIRGAILLYVLGKLIDAHVDAVIRRIFPYLEGPPAK